MLIEEQMWIKGDVLTKIVTIIQWRAVVVGAATYCFAVRRKYGYIYIYICCGQDNNAARRF